MANIFRTLFNGMSAFLSVLKNYFQNSSLAGVGYIANPRYHFVERMFWLACITVSAFGSYYLIKEYQKSFETNAISMVIEEIRPMSKIQFPSVGICELGYIKEKYPNLENYVKSLHHKQNYDVEDFLLRMVYQNMYNYGAFNSYCSPYFNCSDCLKCPEDGYDKIAKKIRTNCSDFFGKCVWKGQPINCCNYFLPLQTTMGECFLLNSVQTTEKSSTHWLDMEIGWDDEHALLELELTRPMAVNILNEEDIPHNLLKSFQFTGLSPGFECALKLSRQNIVNDQSVRDISSKHRKCLFPDETPKNFSYKYHSFSTCVTQCIKETQLKLCNCTNYNLVVTDDDDSPKCDFKGFLCLDKEEFLYPQTTIMQPWRNGLVCQCLPSCTESEIQIIEQEISINPEKQERFVQISLQSLPTQQYRRQAVRGQLDGVVSIGGILGLFMGASILSAIELLYFFTVRILGSAYLLRRKNISAELENK